MKKGTRVLLIWVAAGIGAYLVYRWYVNRSGGTTGTGLGSNLNSLAPNLVAGSSGPSSGLNYYGGNTQVYLTMPNKTPAKHGR